MKRKQAICALLGASILTGSFAACGGKETVEEPPKDQYVGSYVRYNEDCTETLMVGGMPFLYTGAEIRLDALMNCEGKDAEAIEPYIAAAAALGVTCVQVPIDWRDLEPEKDVYDYSVINTVLSLCLKYKLKCEFLWFSLIMCGDSHSFHIPQYIWQDETTYPKYDSGHKNTVLAFNYYGEYAQMQYDHPAVLEREKKMIGLLSEYIYTWEEVRSFPNVLIGIQVYNEVNIACEKRIDLWNISKNGKTLSKDELYKSICTALENASKAFKNGKYSVFTRTNITAPAFGSYQGLSGERIKELSNVAGLDSVGYDPYIDYYAGVSESIDYFQKLLPENLTNIAENKGSYAATDQYLLIAASKNCGYVIYDLATPAYFIANNDQPHYIDHGILTYDTLEDKEHTQDAREILFGMKGAAAVLADVKPDNFAVFNVKSVLKQDEYSSTVNTDNVTVSFSTTKAALGYAVEYNGYLTVFATDEAEMRFANGTFSGAEVGQYDGFTWNKSADAVLQDGALQLEGGKIYRIKIDSTNGALENTTKNNK